jgi:hypothetical protein
VLLLLLLLRVCACRLRRENEALKGLLLELASDRQAAQSRLEDLQQKLADLATNSMSEVRPQKQEHTFSVLFQSRGLLWLAPVQLDRQAPRCPAVPPMLPLGSTKDGC